MRLEALLRAHAFMKVERPPEVWEVDTEDVRLVPLLGEMIAAALGGGADLGELTLNVSNVVVDTDDDEEPSGQSVPPGEFVAVTVIGHTDLGSEGVWRPGSETASPLLDRLRERLTTAGGLCAYVRRIPPVGSITVFLPRLGVGADATGTS